MSKEVLVVDRIYWESMRFLDKKAAFMRRYLELEELNGDDLDLD